MVLFEGPYSIFIEGSLLADGSIADPILFTSGEDYETPGDWESIQFNSTSGTTSSVSYAVIEYAEIGIRCEGSSPSIRNSNITKTSLSGIYTINSDSNLENNSIVENLGHGIHSVSSNLQLYGNSISDNAWDGVIIQASSSPILTENQITSNGYDGVHIDDSDVVLAQNDMSFNQHNGVLLRGSQDAILDSNRITNNSWDGLNSLESQSQLTGNIITDNGVTNDFSGLSIHGSNSQIADNYIACNQGNAILFEESAGEILNNSIILNNIGIGLRRSSPIIRNNNPIKSNYYGIYVNQSSPIVEGNLLNDNRYGVYSIDSSGIVIEDNIITNSVGKDILVGNEEGNVIQFTGTGGLFFDQLGSLRTTDQTKIDVDLNAVPTTVDMDGDGRLDLVIGNEHGFFYYYRNTGDGYEYMGMLSNTTPLMDLDIGTYSHPFVIDWDSDGDLDLFVGQGDGGISYFTNDGGNIFYNRTVLPTVILDSMAAPIFLGWVGNNPPLDLVAGSGDGWVRSYLGTGPTSFTLLYPLYLNGTLNPIDVGMNSSPILTQWNNNTNYDLIIGDGQGNLSYYEERSAGFLFQDSVRLTNGSVLSIQSNCVPALEDWNSDGFLDLILGGDGYVYYYENAGDNTFRAQVHFQEMTANLSVGNWSAPFVIDWNGDSIFDLVVGDDDGYLTVFLGQEPGNVSLGLGQRIQIRGSPKRISVGEWSAPAMVDWNNDGDPDLIAGSGEGVLSYYENEGSNEFIFQWNLSTGGPELDVGSQSAPRIVDWDDNGIDDLLVGDYDGYVHRYERIPGDLQNLTDLGPLDADGSQIRVGQRSVPCTIDLEQDGDLDLLVGDSSGLIQLYEMEGGLLYGRGYLRTDFQNLTVDGFSAPLALGWEASSDNSETLNGLFFENSTASIIDNEVIRGGGGGFAVFASNSTISLEDNGWVAGGKGPSVGGSASKPSPGGHGIHVIRSSIFVSNTPVRGGDGSDVSALRTEGGDGGVGIEIEDCELIVLNSTVIGGAGRGGLFANGMNGAGLIMRGSQDAFLDSTMVRGGTAIHASDSSVYVRNGLVASEQYDFDLGNASYATSMNTSFDRSKVIFRDTNSSLTVGWHLHIRAFDGLYLPVPGAQLEIYPATYTNMGILGQLVTGPASPTIANLSSPSSTDLLIGDYSGNIQFFTWNGNQFIYNGTVNLSAGGPIADEGPCSADFADWDGDGDLDLFLGNGTGSILLFNNTGDGTFDTGYPLNLTGGVPINTSMQVAISVEDWNGDGGFDLFTGGDGYINYFENNGSGYFLPGRRVEADGSEIGHGSWSSPEVFDFDGDGLLDLLVGTEDGRVALYLNNTFNELKFAGYLMTNNSLLRNIDAGNRSIATFADLDGDGHPDLLAGNSDGDVEWFRSNRYAGESNAYTDDNGTAIEIPVVEYVQMDFNGDSDGEDNGERLYLSPSMIQASRCGRIGNVAPLPHVKESLSIIIQLNMDLGNCPPIVLSTHPYQNQENVPVSSSIEVIFDKDMDNITVDASLLFNGSVSPTWLTNKHVLIGVSPMDFNESYTLTIDGSIAQDILGRGLDGNANGSSEGSPIDDYVLRFRTEPIPQVVSHSPDGSGHSVDSIVSLCFNKAMNRSSVEQHMALAPAVNYWTWWDRVGSCVYIDAELDTGTTYTASIWGDATDSNGNTLDGNANGVLQGGFADRYEWQFSTIGDTTPPSVVDTFPADGQTNVGLNPDITVNFTKSIDYKSLVTGLSISGNGITWGAGTGPGFVPIHDFGLISIEGSTLKISYVNLQYDTEYQILLSGDLSSGIQDLAGNSLDGNADGVTDGSPDDDYNFTFSTIDPIPPTVVFTYPANGDSGIQLRPTIRAIFDEEMDTSSLNDMNVSLNTPLNTVPLTVSYLSNNHTLLLEPNIDLDYNSDYTVNISSRVRDVSHNMLDGNVDGSGSGTYEDDYVWSFRTIRDRVPPEVYIQYPLNGTIFTTGDIVHVNGTAFDSGGIVSVDIRLHSDSPINITDSYNEINGTWFYDWDTSNLDGGVYLITVSASDSESVSEKQRVIEIKEPVAAYPVWIPILLTIIILVGATIGYRYLRSTYVERERADEQRKAEMEEMLRRIEEDQATLVKRATEIEEKELDLDAKEDYLRSLDEQYASMAESLIEKESIDLAMGESIVEQEMGENAYEVKQYEKAFTLLSEAEASEAGEITKKLPESGKKAMLLVYFNALEAYLREKLQEMIPTGATILLGEKGHINTRSRGWEDKWAMLSLGTLTHAIDHNKHFFVEDEEYWEEVQAFLRETVEIRNLTAHPSEANPDVSDVRKRVYSAILSLSSVLKRPREVKK